MLQFSTVLTISTSPFLMYKVLSRITVKLCVFVHLSVHVSVCMCVSASVCVHVHVHVRVSLCVCGLLMTG